MVVTMLLHQFVIGLIVDKKTDVRRMNKFGDDRDISSDSSDVQVLKYRLSIKQILFVSSVRIIYFRLDLSSSDS